MANSLLLLLVLSGFYITLSDAWDALYRATIFIHPLLGLYFSTLMYRFGWRRLRGLAPGFSLRLWLGVPVFLALFFAIPGVARPSPGRFHFFLFVLSALFLLGTWRLTRASDGFVRVQALVNYIGLSAWTLALLSGLTALSIGFQGRASFVFYDHRVIGIVFTAIVLLQLGFDWWVHTYRPESSGQPQARPSRLYTVSATAAIVVIVLTAVHLYEQSYTDPALEVHLSTLPLEERDPQERDMHLTHPDVNPVSVNLTQSCLNGSGCHEALGPGFFQSNHNISLMTPHIQKNMDLMASEVGEHNTAICLGCHAPAAMFDDTMDRRHFETHDNFSCSFCHVVSEVWLDPEHHLKSSYTVQPPNRHLALFVDDQGEKAELEWWARAAIMMDPLGHARAFTNDYEHKDMLCVACHRHQIDLETNISNLMAPSCADCHMQPLEDFGDQSIHKRQRNHFMPGANILVPLFANRQTAAELVHDWVDGRYVISLGGWENRGWEYLGQGTSDTGNIPYHYDAVDGLRGSEPSRQVWLAMILRKGNTPVRGTTAAIEIVTSNAGIGHNFPAAPLDLAEVWLEVRIMDVTGQLILEVGQLQDDRTVPEDAPRLGGTVVSVPGGEPIELYRVWQNQKNVPDRILHKGRHIIDRFEFFVPHDATGPFSVTARWNYRKLNREFLDWAYGPDVHVPILEMGSLDAEVALAGNAPAKTGAKSY